MIAKKGLGRGLGALITMSDESVGTEQATEDQSGVIEIDINKIEPNINQPRKTFDEAPLVELAESIKEFGVIQPLIVKKENDYYSIIAGERRWRAARMAKLNKIPVIIKEYNELETLQIALIENIQRADLNPIEEAQCYKRLSEDFFFTQEDIAKKVSKNRSFISNSMRLLTLDLRVQRFVSEGKLSMGHARALLSLEDKEMQFELSEKIIEDELNVRDIEKFVKEYNEAPVKDDESVKKKENKFMSNTYKSIENDLKTILGTRVNIRDGKNKGKIEIEYYSPDDLDRLLVFLKGSN